MSSALTWEPCRFRGDGALEHPQIHDNFVNAAVFHLEQQTLILHTHYRDGSGPYELIDVRFVEVVAHHFDVIASPSILFDIERVSVEWLIQQQWQLIESRKNYGWPIKFADMAELSRELTERNVWGFRVMGSCGLDGFVLAKSVDCRLRDRVAEFA